MSIGSFVSGIFGSENENTAEKPAVDANAYNYGGYEGGADDAANRYRANAANAQGRGAAQADYTQANESTRLGLNARGDMNQVGQAQLARALGKVPSIAQMQGDRQMGQVAAQQAALGASARGRGALANAATTAANNTANAQGAIAGQTQINAAAERAQAEAGAAGTFGNMQQLDLGRSGLATGQAQYQATNQMQQRELNDRMTSDQLKNELAVQGMQLGASQNLQAQKSANSLGAAGINAGVGGQNAAMNQSNAYGVLGLGAQVAGGYAAGGGGGSVTGKADGGPVKENQPYLVGERGPELIVPKKDAVVVPSEVTVPMLSTWGKGGQDTTDARMTVDDVNLKGEHLARLNADAQSYVDPYQRVINREKAGRMAGLTPSEDDGSEGERLSSASEERYAKQMVRRRGAQGATAEESPKADANERQAVSEGKAVPQAPTLRSRIGKSIGTVGDGATKLANAVDTSYHGPSGFSGPQLIPVAPPRAMGGPVAGGNPYTVGENGPELVVPQVFDIGHGMRNAGGSADPGGGLTKFSGGGMDVLGSLKAQSNFATQFQRNPTGSAMASPVARADGGPVQKGQTALVGERGPEMVVDLDEPTIDLGEVDADEGTDKSTMRDGSSDPRTNSMDKTFHRDTPADQARVKRGVEDKASKDADAMMASFRKSLEMGPSVAVRDQDGNDKRVAAREEGGPVAAGQPAVVGEAGPEAVVPAKTGALANIGTSLRSALGMDADDPNTVARSPRAAEISSGAPMTTGAGPGVKLVASGHGYAAEKAPQMAKDQEMTRYTRQQKDDIEYGPKLMPLSTLLTALRGGR